MSFFQGVNETKLILHSRKNILTEKKFKPLGNDSEYVTFLTPARELECPGISAMISSLCRVAVPRKKMSSFSDEG